MTWARSNALVSIEAAHRKVAGYSKGMRQRIRLAQAIAHDPSVLILDEPLNGLDPMARAEMIRLFRQLAQEGLHLIVSSHILHEVDMMSDRVVLINNGYVVAEGGVRACATRSGRAPDADPDPLRPAAGVRRARLRTDTCRGALHQDRQGLFVKTRTPTRSICC